MPPSSAIARGAACARNKGRGVHSCDPYSHTSARLYPLVSLVVVAVGNGNVCARECGMVIVMQPSSSETRVRFIHSFTFSLETHSVKSLLSSLEITTITINVAVRWMVAGTRPARIESDSQFVSTRWWLLIIIMEIKISTLVGRSRPERTLLTTTRGH